MLRHWELLSPALYRIAAPVRSSFIVRSRKWGRGGAYARAKKNRRGGVIRRKYGRRCNFPICPALMLKESRRAILLSFFPCSQLDRGGNDCLRRSLYSKTIYLGESKGILWLISLKILHSWYGSLRTGVRLYESFLAGIRGRFIWKEIVMCFDSQIRIIRTRSYNRRWLVSRSRLKQSDGWC